MKKVMFNVVHEWMHQFVRKINEKVRALNHPGICDGDPLPGTLGLPWMTSSPSQPTSLLSPGRVDSPSTTSGRSGDTCLSTPPNCWSKRLSSPSWTTATRCSPGSHHAQPAISRGFRTQLPNWSSTYPDAPMLPRSSSPFTGCPSRSVSDSRPWTQIQDLPSGEWDCTRLH